MPSVGFISLGCAKNQVNTEQMICLLSEAGYTISPEADEVDVAVVNTCGFIDSAKSEAIANILMLAERKQLGRVGKILVAGCLSERYRDEILEELPEVDGVLGTGSYYDIVQAVEEVLGGGRPEKFGDIDAPIPEVGRVLTTPRHYAFLKIAEGCDNRCAYCAIPEIRGRFRSRKMESVIAEAKELAKGGVKEIILIAQDTTKYGQDIYGEYKLDELLKQLVLIDGIEWIRLFYCYPHRITDSLIDVIANEEKVCKYIDIPLQHGSDHVLKSMNRYGTVDDYKALIAKMREKIPGLSLRTTFMVGFPGETEEDFEELCDFVKEVKFEKMGCFSFSPEENTPAIEMDNQIDEDVKKRRNEVLMNTQYYITEDANKKRIGNTYKVIVDSYDGENYVGRSYMDSPEIDSGIIFTSDDKLEIGSFVNVKITSLDGYDLIGERVL